MGGVPGVRAVAARAAPRVILVWLLLLLVGVLLVIGAAVYVALAAAVLVGVLVLLAFIRSMISLISSGDRRRA